MTDSIKYGLLNGLVGLIIGLIVYSLWPGEWEFFPVASTLSGFLTSLLFWRIINKKTAVLKTSRVVMTGVLTGIISHYICWLLYTLLMNICYWTTGGCLDIPISLHKMITAGLTFTPYSLLIFGWLTTSLSVLIGIFIKRRQKFTHNT